MRKGKKDNKILFIDASNECIKLSNNNKLTEDNINRIVNIYAERRTEKHFSYLASYDEITDNSYNISVSTYVEAEDNREEIDIVAINKELDELVAQENSLRARINEIISGREVRQL